MLVSATARMRDALTRASGVDLGFDLGLGQRRKGYSRKPIGGFEQTLDPPPAKLFTKERLHGLGLEKSAGLSLPSYTVGEAELDLELSSGGLVAHGASFLTCSVYTTAVPLKNRLTQIRNPSHPSHPTAMRASTAGWLHRS